jgi:TolA-binding protein
VKRLIQNSLPCILLIIFMLSASSCSWLSQRRGLFEGPESTTEVGPNTPVPREQYEQLMKQHQELVQRHQLLQQEWQASKQDPQLLGELRLARETPELAETVDVFSGRSSPQIRPSSPAPSAPSVGSTRPVIDSRVLDPAMVEEHILILRNSNTMIAQNRYDQALREIRKIENSPIRQIRARAKFNLGEVLFQQGEFDLAMQIFEDVIKTEAFSGIVLKTLGRLIVCSERLNQEQKRETYFSMFHDFFEQQS